MQFQLFQSHYFYLLYYYYYIFLHFCARLIEITRIFKGCFFVSSGYDAHGAKLGVSTSIYIKHVLTL